MIRFSLFVLVSMSIITLLAPPLLLGQAQRAIILGRVADSSGGVLPGVEVRVIQKSTNVVWNTITNDRGNYEVPGLFPGTYRVEASLTGFKTSVVDGLPVRSGQTVEVNVTLEVGQISESVTVDSELAVLDRASADVNTVFRSDKVPDLPIGQRNASYLLYTTPGVSRALSAVNDPYATADAATLRVNGTPQGTTEYTLDGNSNMEVGNSVTGGGPAFMPSVDMVEEVRIQTNSFDASTGHTAGSTVDLVMKSGTNNYHGTAFINFRNVKWNANLWQANRANLPRAPLDFQFWGASTGGPVRLGRLYNGKDRTFFFYAFERWTRHQGIFEVASVPTAAMLNGDFSKLLALGTRYQLYDPNTGVRLPDGRIERQPFLNNIIPATRIDPVARQLFKLWPAPNQPGTADDRQNFTYDRALGAREYWASTLRLDHVLTRTHKLSGTLILSNTEIPFQNLYGQESISASQFSGKNRNGWISDQWTISPSFIADFRASLTRFHFPTRPGGEGYDWGQLGLGYLKPLMDTEGAGIPNVRIAGMEQVQANLAQTAFFNQQGSRVVSETRAFSTNFTKVVGNHSLKFGADVRFYPTNWGQIDIMTADFSGAYTTGPFNNSAAPPSGAGLADFLLGRFASSSLVKPVLAANLGGYQAVYVGDTWKFNPQLTVTAGLRYEHESPSTERYDRAIGGFDFNTDNPIEPAARVRYATNPIPEIAPADFQVNGGLLFAGVGGTPRTPYDNDNNNFSPRIGLAYQVNSRTVLRAGYGVFFVPYGFRFFANNFSAPGFDSTTQYFSTLDGGLSFPNSFGSLFADGLVAPTGSSLGLKTRLGQGVSLPATLLRNKPNAYTQRWSLSLQRQFGGVYSLEARYVGTRTIKFPINRELNPLPNTYLSRAPERDQATINRLTQLVPNPFVGLPDVGGNLGVASQIARSSLLLPFPHFTSLVAADPVGFSTYHALQLEFERRFAQGLALQTNFTWSKTMDALTFLNPGDSRPEYAVSDADFPLTWRFLGKWELPFGPGKAFGPADGFGGHLIGGWQLQAIAVAQSGNPVNWGNVLFRGDIKSITLDDRTPERMFNIDSGFERDPARQLASNLRTFPTRLSGVRVEGLKNIDLSLLKNTRITESVTLQFRAEALDVLNHHNYTEQPNTTPTSTAFGTTTFGRGNREIQLGLKLIF